LRGIISAGFVVAAAAVVVVAAGAAADMGDIAADTVDVL